MRSEGKKMSAFVSESRKIRKPLMEKKRRARINDSLETLKQILLESKATLKESSAKKSGQRSAKLEKADILEMTVRYLQHLRNKINSQNAPHEPPKGAKEEVRVRAADSSCDGLKMAHVTLVPTKLENGEIAFVVPSGVLKAKKNVLQKEIDAGQNVWRPW